MDLETENRIAAFLLKEAAELRRHRQPTVRNRPNSRFLTATVRANRVVEVNEMWRLREKQINLENKLRGGKSKSSVHGSYSIDTASRNSSRKNCNEVEASSSGLPPSSRRRMLEDCHHADNEGLRDDEVDEFFNSRTKRGRGAVGSRMDEASPYLPCPDFEGNESEELKKCRVLLGRKLRKSSDVKSVEDKKHDMRTHYHKHSKHKSKEKSKDKKNKRREKKEKKT